MESKLKIRNPPNDQDIIEVAKKLCAALENDINWEQFGMNLLDITSNERLKLILQECEGKSPVTKYKRLLEVWVKSTPKSECRWEKVTGILKKMGFGQLASDLTDAMETNGSRDDQSNGTIGLGTEAVSENRTSSEPSEASCRNQDETNHDVPRSKRPRYSPDIDEEKLKQEYDDRKFEDSMHRENLLSIKGLEQPPSVLIQTVNNNEYYAVMLQLKEGSEVVCYTDGDSSYVVGEWGESGIPVIIIQTIPGSDRPYGSREETRKALGWFPNLKYVFTVGVCGGVKNKVDLGDVVVSTVIQGYSLAKKKGGEHINRFPPWDITKKTKFHQDLSRAANNVKCGMVLSGNLLIADRESQKPLLREYKEAIAFEMEGHGIADACDVMKKDIVYMIVKGVCDLADEDKDDRWQPQAATNAAKALCKAMKYSPLFVSTRGPQSSSTTDNTEPTNDMTDHGEAGIDTTSATNTEITDGHKESTIDHTRGENQKQDVSQLERESQQRVRTRSQSASRATVERKTGKQSTERSASKKKATRNQKQGVSSRGSGKGHN